MVIKITKNNKKNIVKQINLMQKEQNNNNFIVDLKLIQQVLNETSLVSITDDAGNIIFVNDKFCKISKYSKTELLGQNHRILKSGHHTDKFYKGMWDTISSGKIWRGDVKNKAKDGTFFWVKMIIMPVFDSHKKISQFISLRTDITLEKELTTKLSDANFKLAKSNETTQRQSAETVQRYILQNQLTESHAELAAEKKFSTQKEEFAAMVSHELKTPIFPIKMHCEMLKDPTMMGTLNAEQLDSVNMIEKMILNLERLTGDIFDAHKLEMKQMQFIKTSFKLLPFFEDVRKNAMLFMGEKNISLTVDAEDIEIITDRERLAQIFSNLIRNSVDFVSEYTGTIEIGAINDAGRIIFFVKDNGVGIPNDKIRNLFRKFYQIDTTLKRKHGGTGLGLVISKGIVEGLGGEISVFSEVKKGTTFSFNLPCRSKLEHHDYITGVRNPLLLVEYS